MWVFLGYLFIAAFVSAIFKFAAGVFEGIIIFPVFGLSTGTWDEKIMARPKRLITAVIFKNTIIGLANSIMILTVSYKAVDEYGGNYWFYFVLAIFWSLFISSYEMAFSGVLFWTSTVNLVFMWFGLGYLSITVVGSLTLIISLAYYYGKIGMYQELAKQNASIATSAGIDYLDQYAPKNYNDYSDTSLTKRS